MKLLRFGAVVALVTAALALLPLITSPGAEAPERPREVIAGACVSEGLKDRYGLDPHRARIEPVFDGDLPGALVRVVAGDVELELVSPNDLRPCGDVPVVTLPAGTWVKPLDWGGPLNPLWIRGFEKQLDASLDAQLIGSVTFEGEATQWYTAGGRSFLLLNRKAN